MASPKTKTIITGSKVTKKMIEACEVRKALAARYPDGLALSVTVGKTVVESNRFRPEYLPLSIIVEFIAKYLTKKVTDKNANGKEANAKPGAPAEVKKAMDTLINQLFNDEWSKRTRGDALMREVRDILPAKLAKTAPKNTFVTRESAKVWYTKQYKAKKVAATWDEALKLAQGNVDIKAKAAEAMAANAIIAAPRTE